MHHKSLVTNLLALICIGIGIIIDQRIVLVVGLFAFSGALTNWLAVHMLFEKVPLMYGSGVIPNRFEDFKQGIYNLMMQEFFTEDNVSRFFEATEDESIATHHAFDEFIETLDFNPTFDSFVDVVNSSSLGGMLGMLGGTKILEPLREPFAAKMLEEMRTIAHSEEFQQTIKTNILVRGHLLDKVSTIVHKRLDELTPQMVKDIIQKMIREHLGWLVVWGGAVGAIIGLISGIALQG